MRATPAGPRRSRGRAVGILGPQAQRAVGPDSVDHQHGQHSHDGPDQVISTLATGSDTCQSGTRPRRARCVRSAPRRSRHERLGSRVGGHRTARRRPVLHSARDVERPSSPRPRGLARPARSAPGPADHVDRLILRNLGGAGAELTQRDVPGARSVARRPFIVFADVEQPRAIGHASRRNLLKLRALIGR